MREFFLSRRLLFPRRPPQRPFFLLLSRPVFTPSCVFGLFSSKDFGAERSIALETWFRCPFFSFFRSTRVCEFFTQFPYNPMTSRPFEAADRKTAGAFPSFVNLYLRTTNPSFMRVVILSFKSLPSFVLQPPASSSWFSSVNSPPKRPFRMICLVPLHFSLLGRRDNR